MVAPDNKTKDVSKGPLSMTDIQTQSQGRITYEKDGALYWITFDNPDRMNAINTRMWAEIPDMFSQAQNDDDVRVVLMRGSGKRTFSSGADISEFGSARTGNAAKSYDELNHAAFNAVLDCTKPTIAMISGFCMGGGLELALCCDLRVAAEGSSYAIPAAKLGIGYNPRWIRPLLSALTATKAKEILFTGAHFTHDQALAMGLIGRLCTPDMLEETTRSLAETIAANAPLSVLAAKQCIDEFLKAPENPDYARLDALIEDCFSSEDYAEGRTAFLEKRKPVFKGR